MKLEVLTVEDALNILKKYKSSGRNELVFMFETFAEANKFAEEIAIKILKEKKDFEGFYSTTYATDSTDQKPGTVTIRRDLIGHENLDWQFPDKKEKEKARIPPHLNFETTGGYWKDLNIHIFVKPSAVTINLKYQLALNVAKKGDRNLLRETLNSEADTSGKTLSDLIDEEPQNLRIALGEVLLGRTLNIKEKDTLVKAYNIIGRINKNKVLMEGFADNDERLELLESEITGKTTEEEFTKNTVTENMIATSSEILEPKIASIRATLAESDVLPDKRRSFAEELVGPLSQKDWEIILNEHSAKDYALEIKDLTTLTPNKKREQVKLLNEKIERLIEKGIPKEKARILVRAGIAGNPVQSQQKENSKEKTITPIAEKEKTLSETEIQTIAQRTTEELLDGEENIPAREIINNARKGPIVNVQTSLEDRIIEVEVRPADKTIGKPAKSFSTFASGTLRADNLEKLVEWYDADSGKFIAGTKSVIIDQKSVFEYLFKKTGVQMIATEKYVTYFWKNTRNIHHKDILRHFISQLIFYFEKATDEGLLTDTQALELLSELEQIKTDLYLTKLVGTQTVGEGLKVLLAASHGFQFSFNTKKALTQENREEASSLVNPLITEFKLSSGIDDDSVQYDVQFTFQSLRLMIEKIQQSIQQITKPQKISIDVKNSDQKTFENLVGGDSLKLNNLIIGEMRCIV